MEGSLMSGMTDYLENKILNNYLRNTGDTSVPATVYVGLFTTATTDSGEGTEVLTAGTGYARQQVTFTAPSGGSSTNAGPTAAAFPVATADWGTITHFALFDASTAGNMLFHAPLGAPVTVPNGSEAKFPPGTLTVTIA